jgi:hypothetical protein
VLPPDTKLVLTISICSFSSQHKRSVSSESRHSHSVLPPDTKLVLALIPQRKRSVSNESRHSHSVLTPDTEQVLALIPQCKRSVSSESRHSHSVLTPDTEQALVTHSTHVGVSSPDTDHNTSSSFPLLHQLATQGIPKSRPNTMPNFRAFDPTIGIEVQSTLKPDRWQSFLKHYPDPAFPNIIVGISQYGARVGYEGPMVRIHGRNRPSVLRIQTEITQNIAAEAAAT